jgi:AAA ATPase domain
MRSGVQKKRSTDWLAYGLGVRLASMKGSSGLIDSWPMYLSDTSVPIGSVRSWLDFLRAYRPQEVDRYKDPELLNMIKDHVFPIINQSHPFWHEMYADYLEHAIPIYKDFVSDFDGALKRANQDGPAGFPDELDKLQDRPRFLRLSEFDFPTYCLELQLEGIVRYFTARGFRLLEPPGSHWNAKVRVEPSIVDEENYADKREWRWVQNLQPSMEWLTDLITLQSIMNLTIDMNGGLQSLLGHLIYIGPLRERPERHYLFCGADPANVGSSGKMAGDLLFNRPQLLERVNEVLGRFNIGHQLDVQKLRDEQGVDSDVYALRLINNESRHIASLRDVGFGISQVLPVLVQSLIATSNIVLIEQPELHLHPRLQAELADVFISSALKGTAPYRRITNTFVIETHSEHLVLRLMRRIRETSRGTLPEGIPSVRREDVSIIYVQPTENGSVPLVMDLDEDGELLTAWPNGFFEEGFRERFA